MDKMKFGREKLVIVMLIINTKKLSKIQAFYLFSCKPLRQFTDFLAFFPNEDTAQQ